MCYRARQQILPKKFLYKYSKQNKIYYITTFRGSTNDAVKETQDIVINVFLNKK